MEYREIEKRINYSFKDKSLLLTAMTHSSYRRENHDVREDNERLEFIGDALLDAVIGIELFKRCPHESEVKLTKLRSLIVCERALSNAAHKLGLNSFLRLGTGERHSGGENKASILADAMEALFGAVYIDGGYDSVRRTVLYVLSDTMEEALRGNLFADYKSEFQERLQKNGSQPEIIYVTDSEEGPPHSKIFRVHVEVSGKTYGTGTGKTKKEAGQNAAKEALEKLRGR